jgi:hypothetical protein
MSEPQEWPELGTVSSAGGSLTYEKIAQAVMILRREPILRELRARHDELCALKLYASPVQYDDLECRFRGVPLYEDGGVLPGHVEARFSDGSRKLICVAKGKEPKP